MRQAITVGRQNGVALLEALISILIFSLGILSLVGLQSIMVRTSIDAKYRADAALLANQIVGAMWASNRTALSASFGLNDGDDVGACGTGTNSADGKSGLLANWLAQVEAVLPGADGIQQQIRITGANNDIVTVTVCWKNVQDASDSRLQGAPPHRFVLSAQMPDNPP